MSKIVIRKANIEDIPGIAHVAATSYIDAFGEYFLNKSNLDKETKERRSEKYFESVFDEDVILVACRNDQIVGYLQFGAMSMNFDTFTKKDIELRRLYVLTDNHRQGVGRALMDSMLVHDQLKNVESIYLEVWEKNPKAVGLYRSFGFEDTGHRRPFFEDGVKVGEDSVYKMNFGFNE